MTRTTPTRPAASRRRGAAAVELAVVLPLLSTLLLAAADFGRFAHSYIAVVNAARAGSGYASLNPPSPTDQAPWFAAIQEVVREELGGLPQSAPDRLSVEIAAVTESGGLRRVSVRVVSSFDTLIPWAFLPRTVALRHTAVFRILR